VKKIGFADRVHADGDGVFRQNSKKKLEEGIGHSYKASSKLIGDQA